MLRALDKLLDELLAGDPGGFPFKRLYEQRWTTSLNGVYLTPKWDNRSGNQGLDRVPQECFYGLGYCGFSF